MFSSGFWAWQIYLNITTWMELLGASKRKGRGSKGKPFGLNNVLTFSAMNLKRKKICNAWGVDWKTLPLTKGVRLCELEHDLCSTLVCSISKMEKLECSDFFPLQLEHPVGQSFGARSWSWRSLWDLHNLILWFSWKETNSLDRECMCGCRAL